MSLISLPFISEESIGSEALKWRDSECVGLIVTKSSSVPAGGSYTSELLDVLHDREGGDVVEPQMRVMF